MLIALDNNADNNHNNEKHIFKLHKVKRDFASRTKQLVANLLQLLTGFSAAHAALLKKYQHLTATQRLATTPLYYIANSRGNSYLQDDMQANAPERKNVIYFMSSDDANDYLDEMSQANSANMNEFRIMAISMEKVMQQIQSKKQSRKLGRYNMDIIYRIQVTIYHVFRTKKY